MSHLSVSKWLEKKDDAAKIATFQRKNNERFRITSVSVTDDYEISGPIHRKKTSYKFSAYRRRYSTNVPVYSTALCCCCLGIGTFGKTYNNKYTFQEVLDQITKIIRCIARKILSVLLKYILYLYTAGYGPMTWGIRFMKTVEWAGKVYQGYTIQWGIHNVRLKSVLHHKNLEVGRIESSHAARRQ